MSCCSREPLINYARSAFLPQKLQIVRSEPSDSSTATAKASHVRDAAFAAKPVWDGPLRALRRVPARSFGMTKPRSPEPGRSTRKDSSRPCIIHQRLPKG